MSKNNNIVCGINCSLMDKEEIEHFKELMEWELFDFNKLIENWNEEDKHHFINRQILKNKSKYFNKVLE